jgi:hypothetical protein
MSRTHQILGLLLLVQIGLAALVFCPRYTTTTVANTPLLATFDPAEVSEVVIRDGEDNQITLAKKGDEWVLPQAGDFPAEGDKIIPLLEKLQGVETGRLVTTTAGSHNRLQVGQEAFNREVTITRPDGSSDTLYLGSAAGAGATHVRVNDQAEVYLTDAVTAFDANPQASSWIDTLYFTLPQTATTTITLENENGTFTFEQEGETWTLTDLAEDEVLNQGSVATLLNQSQSIQMTEPIGPVSEAGSEFDQPLATVTIENANQTYTLQVGPKDEEDGSYLFLASSSPYYVRISQFVGDNFVTKTRQDFLEVPPAEEGLPVPPEGGSGE